MKMFGKFSTLENNLHDIMINIEDMMLAFYSNEYFHMWIDELEIQDYAQTMNKSKKEWQNQYPHIVAQKVREYFIKYRQQLSKPFLLQQQQ